MILEVYTETKFARPEDADLEVILLLCENSKFGFDEKPYYLDVAGLPMHKYLENVASGFKTKLVILPENASVADVVRPYLGNATYTAILYSDTPLLSRETFLSYVQKMLFGSDKFLVMPRGYIFETEYLKGLEKINPPELKFFESSEFFEVKNLSDLADVNKAMEKKIIEFHLSRGVRIIDKNLCYIGCEVDIGKGTTIYPFTSLLGRCVIGENCEIKSSQITSSRIGDNVKLTSVVLEKSVVSNGAKIKPFSHVVNKEIKGDKKWY